MKRGEPLKPGKGLVRKTPLRGRPAPLRRSEGLARGNGPLRGPASGERRARPARPCELCGEQFEPRWAGRAWTRTCSTSCARELRARSSRKPKVTLTCEVCERTWEVQPSQAKGRRSCSRACAAKLKRREGASTRKGPANPNYRGGQRAGERDREGERRWYAAMGRRCEAPACPGGGGRLALHHVVYRQAVRRANGDVWDPRNALTLCNSCHGSHHHRGRVLPVTALPDAVFAFAAETLGAGPAYEYLRRRYVDDDSRLAQLLDAA